MEGWNIGWDGDWIENRERVLLHEGVSRLRSPGPSRAYAKSKGVRLIVHNETSGGIENYERQMDGAFALYHSLGLDAIKTGYVTDTAGGGHSHYGAVRWCEHYRQVIETAARTASWWTRTSRFTTPASVAPIRT